MKKHRVLIALRESIALQALDITLHELGIEVKTVKSGLGIVETCLLDEDVFLIVFDVDMPDMNGYEVVRYLRQYCNPDLCCIMVAYFSIASVGLALSMGCNEFIAKPLREDEMKTLIVKYYDAYAGHTLQTGN